MIDVNKISFYDENEVRKIIESKEKYVYVDDGMTEVIIKKEDIPDYIVYINRECGLTDLKMFDSDGQQILNTLGEFLDKCNPIIREEIIDRLVNLQTGEEEPKEVKTIDEYMWEKLTNEIEEDEEESI
ncbi:MAG: hypothetical protein IKD76_02550 [Clostridia bacterium]|nr:hypothetical protein [Clostridia bacterium]MEE0866188.1 hypothetical protein [Clostridia bacterium]